jgi:AraC-like DNA-binding protein
VLISVVSLAPALTGGRGSWSIGGLHGAGGDLRSDRVTQLLFLDDGLAYLGRSFESASSCHHAILLCVALEGSYAFVSEELAIERCVGVLLGPDVAYRYDGRGALVLSLFLDPESRRGRRARSLLGIRSAMPLEASVLAQVAGWGRAPDLEAALDALVTSVVGDAERAPLDPRIARVLGRFAEGAPSLSELAAETGLSTSRFRHLFAEATGIPYKRYALQRRIQRAARSLAEGRSVAAAAHAAGFSDEAHLSRTFRQTFGVRVRDAFVAPRAGSDS